MKLYIDNDKDDGRTPTSNSTSLFNASDGSHDILIIGGIFIVLIMVFWLVCCILVYKKKIFVGLSQGVKNSLKNCCHRKPSGTSAAYFNHGSPYDQPCDDLILPVFDPSDHRFNDPAQERLPT